MIIENKPQVIRRRDALALFVNPRGNALHYCDVAFSAQLSLIGSKTLRYRRIFDHPIEVYICKYRNHDHFLSFTQTYRSISKAISEYFNDNIQIQEKCNIKKHWFYSIQYFNICYINT